MALTVGIESISEQFITAGTEDYDLVIDISGRPDTVKVTGHMEGFGQDWDAANGQLHIKSEEVTRLINGVNWDIEVVKDMQTLTAEIAYNVVEAAPIFGTLQRIHLYRGVPINFDIIIQNIPPLLIPDAELLGLKSDLMDYGVSVKGQISSTDRFSFNSGNVSIIVPSDSGGADTTYNYPYQIETGQPGQIQPPKFTPKGGHGELEFTDVTHALGYEWTLQEGAADRVDWSVFDSTRQLIDPDKVEVTPGQLQVTIKFPNIEGASSYEYRLESDDHEVDWTQFTGTLENGFITTIIPDLEDGVEYTLRLRVASPWVGTPISVTVYGGRIFYLLNYKNTGSHIFVAHTGVENGASAHLIKRVGIPSSVGITNRQLGLAVSGNTAYVSRETSDTIYVLDINVKNGANANLTRTFLVPTETSLPNSLSIKNNVLLVADRADRKLQSFSATAANNTRASLIEEYSLNWEGGVPSSSWIRIAVRGDFLVVGSAWSHITGFQVGFYPFNPIDYSRVEFTKQWRITNLSTYRDGVEFIGDKVYACSNAYKDIAIIPQRFQDSDFKDGRGFRFSDPQFVPEGIKIVGYPIGTSTVIDMSFPT